MIISASRRTDIPAVFSDWFFNRIEEEYAIIPNPMFPTKFSRIDLSPSVVDCIVFWTKNPIPMMDRLHMLDKYRGHYYFTFTLNAYAKDAEPNIPDKASELIPAFIELSKAIGKERVCWRYDPIFLNDRYDMEYHKRNFRLIADRLAPYTEKCTVSFIDMYDKTKRNMMPLSGRAPTPEEEYGILEDFAAASRERGLILDTCCEAGDFSSLGIQHAHCIDKDRIERLVGARLKLGKDSTQREVCGCVSSIDIGTYNTCTNLCLYCYANFNHNIVLKNQGLHDPHSPLLLGDIADVKPEAIHNREMKSLIEEPTLF